jgi:hypothetical protein
LSKTVYLYNMSYFQLRMPKLGDFYDSNKKQEAFKVIVNEKSFDMHSHYLRNVSRRVAKLPEQDNTFTPKISDVNFTQEFLKKWFNALNGEKKTNILLEELPEFAVFYKEFEINGDIIDKKGRRLADYIEDGISHLLSESSWIDIIEVASKLEFNKLFASCLSFLSQYDYSLLKELEKPLKISHEYLNKLVIDHNNLREKTGDASRFMTFRDICKFVSLQLDNESDEDKRADVEEDIIGRCMITYGAEAKNERLTRLEEALDKNFETMRQLDDAYAKELSDCADLLTKFESLKAK